MSFDLFKSSTPGQSLTQEPGSAPYEMPPQYTDVNEALEYLFDKLTEPRQVTRLVLMLKKGMPVEYLARTILFEGFSKNRWTPDLSVLMLRIVMAMLISIATAKGVKPKIFNPDKEQEEFLDQFLDMTDEDEFEIEDENMEDDTEEDVSSTFTGILGAKS